MALTRRKPKFIKWLLIVGALILFLSMQTHNKISGRISLLQQPVSGWEVFLFPQKNKRAFICVTGLLEALELENKIVNLISPILEENYHVEISLILQTPLNDTEINFNPKKRLFPLDREPYSFTSDFSGPEFDFGWPEKLPDGWEPSERSEPIYKSDQQIIESLRKNFSSRVSVNVDLYDPLINPPMNPEYVYALALDDSDMKKTGFLRRDRFERILWRAVTNARMLENYHRCSARLEQTGQFHSMALHVGEDAIMNHPINISKVEDIFAKSRANQVIASIPCTNLRQHRNDQVDIISPAALGTYFDLPYNLLYRESQFIDYTHGILSAFLKRVYIAGGATILSLSEGDNETSFQTLRLANDTTTKEGVKALREMAFEMQNVINPNNIIYPVSYEKLSYGDAVAYPSSNATEKRALLCITGQLARAEFENKLETLIKPTQNAGFRVDIALALSHGAATWHFGEPDNHTQPYENGEQVRDFFKSHNLDVISEPKTYDPNWMMPINPQYTYHKARRNPYKKPQKAYTRVEPEKIRMLLINFVRANSIMTESYTRCWRDAVNSRRNYNLFIRARDDIGFSEPLDMSNMLTLLKPHSTLASSCRENSGINDRFAIVSPESAKCYFNAPFARLYDGGYLPPAVTNTESLFKRVYWENNCTTVHARREIVPYKILSSGSIDQIDMQRTQCGNSYTH